EPAGTITAISSKLPTSSLMAKPGPYFFIYPLRFTAIKKENLVP
ncbi:MAG: hypothetical protein ACI9BO_002089, partial [Zhongshania sp.]